jgi:uncharacterized membrane protein YbhN (UPF0104 family)
MPPQRESMLSRIKRIVAHPVVKVGYFALLLAAGVYYLVRWGDRLPSLLGQIQPVPLAAAFGVTCVSSLFYSYVQYSIYRHLGAPPRYWTVFRITSISQLGKYLPGKVLFAGNFYLLSRAAGIGNLQIGAAFVISMALWILTATLCGLPVLGLLRPALRYSILLLPLLLALLIYPRFLGILLQLAQGISGRLRSASGVSTVDLSAQADLLARLDTVFYLRVGFLYLVVWALAGLGAYLCLSAFTEIDLSTFPLALASIALGTVAGFLALFAPVGLGVREGIGALVLAPAVGTDVALLSMVLLRGITVVVDLLLALLAMLSGRWAMSNTALQE